MGEILKVIRDLTIIIAIYLYFIAWVYVHFYYQQFGISTNAVKIDYNSYLMYSYNVLTSSTFISWLNWFCLIVLLFLLVKWMFAKIIFLKRSGEFFSGNILAAYIKKLNHQYILFFVILSGFIFPQLFKISRQVAINQYKEDRLNTHNLKTIQFIFRKDADLMSPAVILDSSLPHDHIFYNDISIIKNDGQQLLRLLGESDNYYIVLQQRPFNTAVGALPTGYVYFIDKKDILLSKIILRSL